MTEALSGPVARISLTQGQYAIVDEADLPLVQGRKWRAHKATNGYYAESGPGPDRVSMHVLLCPVAAGMIVDHADNDGLNNRRSNLRPATQRQNMYNRRSKVGASKFKGVYFNHGKWRACIMQFKKTIHLGSFESEEAAARRYDQAALELFGEFAKTNEMLGLLAPRLAAA